MKGKKKDRRKVPVPASPRAIEQAMNREIEEYIRESYRRKLRLYGNLMRLQKGPEETGKDQDGKAKKRKE